DALARELSSRQYAALILEPIQGEAGVVTLSDEYLRAARELTRETGTLLVLDEVQSGCGRTGAFLASQQSGILADLVCLAKPLAAGLPIGTTLAARDVGESLGPGDHGSTFGGGPLVCRAALVLLSELFDHGLLEHVEKIGAAFQEGLIGLERRHDCVAAQRGRGLMQALALRTDAGPVADGLAGRGLLASATAGKVLRFLPPFVIGRAQIDEALSILDAELGLHDSARYS
ncbi:MAG: aspartate aminotransferase family protein, partial [Planctomycetota bacterium]